MPTAAITPAAVRFGKEGGKYNAETVADKSDIMGTQAFADILHNNLAPAAVEVMAANVATANVTGCGDFRRNDGKSKRQILRLDDKQRYGRA